MGSVMYPTVRPGNDHAHMAPAILNHLKNNNYEQMPDRFGRRDASFYKNYLRQEMQNDFKPNLVKKLN